MSQNARILQHRILDRFFLITIVSTIIIIAADLPSSIQDSRWLAFSLNYTIFILLLVAAIFRKFNYYKRIAILVLALLVLGLSTILKGGFHSIGLAYLFVLPVFSILLTGEHGSKVSSIFGIGVSCLVFSLVLSEIFILGDINLISSPQFKTSFTQLMVICTLFSIGATYASGLVAQGFEKSIETQNLQSQEFSNERALLESKIQHRTDELHRRLVQIRTAAEINRAISRMLDIDQLLPEVCELVRQRFGLYYAGIFLIESLNDPPVDLPTRNGVEQAQSEDPNSYEMMNSIGWTNKIWKKNRSYAVLKAGSGEAGRRMLSEGHRLLVGGDSMIGWATANHKPRIAQNVGQEVVRFNNPHLPLTRSEIALPILIHVGKTEGRSEGQEGQKEQILGAMTIQSIEESAFDEDDILILQSIVDSLAAAIDNSYLFTSTRDRLDEIRALHRQYLAQAWQKEITMRGEIVYSYPSNEPALDQSPGGDLLEIPIRLRDQVIGILTMESGEGENLAEVGKSAWSSDDLVFVETVTKQAALALENARLLEETRRKAQREQLISVITDKLRSTLDLETVLNTAVREIGQQLGFSQVEIHLNQTGEPIIDRANKPIDNPKDSGASLPIRVGQAGGNGKMYDTGNQSSGQWRLDATDTR